MQHMCQALADELNRKIKKPELHTLPLRNFRPDWASTWTTHLALVNKSTSYAPQLHGFLC